LGAALLTTREGLEASLIVGIVLAYLAKTGNRDRFRVIWAGTAAAVLISIVTGAALFFTVGELEGRSEQLFEGAAMLSAVAVLTWMIFWMRNQAKNIKGELEAKLASAVAAGSAVGLASVVFFAVLREGWETSLFLFAISESSSPVSTSIGAAAGLVVSISLGIALYMGSRRLNLRQFFTVTGVLLIVFAAGLLAHATHEFQEAGILPATIEHVWNTNGIVSEDSSVGKFLKTLFGYNGDPSLLEVAVWIAYLAGALTFFLRPLVGRRSRPAAATAADPALRAVGVDGTREGWIAVALDDGTFETTAFSRCIRKCPSGRLPGSLFHPRRRGPAMCCGSPCSLPQGSSFRPTSTARTRFSQTTSLTQRSPHGAAAGSLGVRRRAFRKRPSATAAGASSQSGY
jgi:high-affinity iron transporter